MSGDVTGRERFEAWIGVALTRGVLVSAALLALGLGLWAAGVEPAGTWLLNAGLLALMLTPAARVAISLVEYVWLRDWFFVAMTLGVLGILAGTLLVALRAR